MVVAAVLFEHAPGFVVRDEFHPLQNIVGHERAPIDEAVMRILASQTAVALQNCELFQRSQTLLAQSEARNAQLLATQRELGAAQRHQVLDSERHRIARELHDSVAQTVLSAGMQIEVCRSEIAALTFVVCAIRAFNMLNVSFHVPVPDRPYVSKA